jgi:uncharacterized RmlC-like cupin family protein
MKSRPVSVEEMESNHVARFNELHSTGAGNKTEGGPIPKEAYQMMAARTAYVITAPGDDNSPWDAATVETPDVVTIIAECEPGEGPSAHMHAKTVETFMALTGEWELLWGDDSEHSLFLKPYDTIAVPPEVVRTFKNVSDEKAYLLVLITGGVHDMDDLSFRPELGVKVAEKFGPAVKKRAEEIGFRFTAGLEGVE